MRIPINLLLLWAFPAMAAPTIIGHAGLAPLDPTTVQRIYTGRVVELKGTHVTPINLPPGHPVRDRFLHLYLDQDEDAYTGYWTVRRYVGKGSPPYEVATPAEVLRFVSKTAGAIGYVDETDLPPDVNVLLRPPP
ncbi:hypothetical protein ThidrDRAFT_3750 [Thiorhodococcus drewsii AZ1]|uniref:Phosphate ABC transporter substrate-binding protein n=1 Tax=Thiorhodococcus drewsii AZ1 TaxID=765913 RepID=G2E637_9GAMM|nr:hypothetical protein [Thiorhodococcus drewsii]EGV28454.1 hypothetical protein ThidrDRAFT_3750 [Thiorhodococcus drewsii AZ1]